MKRSLKPIDLTLAGMFVALMAIGANITNIAPFMVVGGVPITLQTFFAVLAGLVLGSRVGSIAMVVYALVGLVGVPVFSEFSGGVSIILAPTFGFILSFILVAFFTGKIVEKYKSVPAFIIAALIGLAINYFVGTNWMYFAYKFWFAVPKAIPYKVAWGWMMVPLPKDIILSVCAGLLAHRLERTVLSKGQFKNLKKAV
ncbi:biotin transporter BioY [Neobacillus sp. PS3-34]|uniref:biotin transporter BioY n=1 Tax=Neobacillus sp. PS3-34 TaxID=3070678 RepID=UPI0027E1A30B|nr:biotin transporter BioY [Neobacillus sp. PS3-34]WML48038.1 biotin transporter BioY [Neobacillus sp. PS3-34]